MEMIEHVQKYAFWGCGGCLLLLILGVALDGSLPDSSEIDPQVRTQPVQGAYTGAQITLEHDGHTYLIEPVATYDMSALIVSENELDQKWIDKLGLSQDVGVVWGENTTDDRHLKYEFSSSSYVLYARVPPGVPFNGTEMGNVHVLPASAEVSDSLDSIERGAQVRLRGKLINYARPDLGPGQRKSSLTRDDTGMGACEVMLVENIEIMSNPNAKYASMVWFGGWGLVCCAILLIATTLYIGLANKPDPRANSDGFDIFGSHEDGSLGEGKHSTLLYYLFFPFLGRWRG
ncbi:hypothetical protein OAU50_07190, partial [Planctomycetota bacterium]|nr:hypothetical protein [Planctomycetota bacterium]